MALKHLLTYPGLAIDFDIAQNPFFETIVSEALGTVNGTKTGKLLLTRIGTSKPLSWPPEGDFPRECRVIITPTMERVFIQDGFRRVYGGQLAETKATGARPFNPTQLSGSCNNALDQTAASNGTGTVCRIAFNNTIMKTSRGEATYPFIVLGHELIHSYHSLTGRKKNGRDEELWTVGIAPFDGEEITENKIRQEAGIAIRKEYYA